MDPLKHIPSVAFVSLFLVSTLLSPASALDAGGVVDDVLGNDLLDVLPDTGLEIPDVTGLLGPVAGAPGGLPVEIPSLGALDSPAAAVDLVSTFDEYASPGPCKNNAGEPTIGIDWNTDAVMFQAYSSTCRITFDDSVLDSEGRPTATWKDKSHGFTLVNADPMLHTDPVSGRTWAGGLGTVCSFMGYSDDDGETWQRVDNPCTIYGVDHQTIGSGPWAEWPGGITPADVSADRAVYYCAHGQAVGGSLPDLLFSGASPTACSTSYDGGVTFGAPVPWIGGCGSLHGHVAVNPADGHAFVPDRSCGSKVGFVESDNNGLTWVSKTVAGSKASTRSFDPSIGLSTNGWMYLAQADENGVHVALSKDDGDSWESLAGDTWLDIGTPAGITYAAFPNVVAGDDDRAAVSFIGMTAQTTVAEAFGDCSGGQTWEWHYYVALTYDAGQTWNVQRLTQDPVQVGSIDDRGLNAGTCRNLLDFNDMDIDSHGRIYIGFADGCVATCADGSNRISQNSRADRGTLLRQSSGMGLFSAFDSTGPTGSPTVSITDPLDGAQVDAGTITVAGAVDRLASSTGSPSISMGADQTGEPGTPLAFTATVTGSPAPACTWSIDAPAGGASLVGSATDCTGATVVSSSEESVTVRLTATNSAGSSDATATATWAPVSAQLPGRQLGTDATGDANGGCDSDGSPCISDPNGSHDIVRLAAADDAGRLYFYITVDDLTAFDADQPFNVYAEFANVAATGDTGLFYSVYGKVTSATDASGGALFASVSVLGASAGPGVPTAVVQARVISPDTVEVSVDLASVGNPVAGQALSYVQASITTPDTLNYFTVDSTDAFTYTLGAGTPAALVLPAVNEGSSATLSAAASAPTTPPEQCDVADQSPGDPAEAAGLTQADVECAWFDSDADFVYVGLKVKDIPADTSTTAQVFYEVSFFPDWDATGAGYDITEGGQLSVDFTGLRVFAGWVQTLGGIESGEVSTSHIFELHKQWSQTDGGKYGELGYLDPASSIDAGTDILWFVIPRDLLKVPASGGTLSDLDGASGIGVVAGTLGGADLMGQGSGTYGIVSTVQPLAADAGGPYAGSIGTPIAISGSGSGGAGSYSCAWTAAGGALGDANACDTTVTYSGAGSHTLELTVTDGDSSTASDSTQVTVSGGTASGERVDLYAGGALLGSVPVSTSASGPTSTDWSGAVDLSGLSGILTLEAVWTDTDDTVLDTATIGLVVAGGTDSIVFTAPTASQVDEGVTTFQGTVSHGATGSPLAVSLSPTTQSGTTADAFPYQATVSGGSAPYSCTWSDDGGAIITNSGCDGASFAFGTAGTYTVTLAVTDSAANSVGAQATALVSDPSPVLAVSAGGPYSGPAGSPVSLQATPSGGAGGYACAWTITAKPAGSTASATPDCSSTFQGDLAGQYDLTVTVTDSAGGTAADTTTVTLTAVTGAQIQITSPADGATVAAPFLLGGTISGLSSAAQQTGWFGYGDLNPASLTHGGIVWEDWMDGLRPTLESLDGFVTGIPTVEGGQRVLTLYFSGDAPVGLAALVPDAWSLRVLDHAKPEPLRQQLPAGTVIAPSVQATNSPNGAAWNTFIGPGSQLAITFENDELGFAPWLCTANWVYVDQNGDLYLGAAGHCFLPSDKSATHGPGADFTPDGNLRVYACRSDCLLGGFAGNIEQGIVTDWVELGSVAYARQTQDGQDVGNDFGIVRIPTELYPSVSPVMPVWGTTDQILDPQEGDLFFLHGNAAEYGETFATKSRTGLYWDTLFGLEDGVADGWTALTPSFGGDSGSAVGGLTPGSGAPIAGGVDAVGILTHGYSVGDPIGLAGVSLNIAEGTKLAKAVTMAEQAGLCLRPLLGGDDPEAVAPAADCGLDNGNDPSWSVQYHVDGGAPVTVDALDTTAGTWSVAALDLADGFHTLRVDLLKDGALQNTDTIAVAVDSGAATGCGAGAILATDGHGDSASGAGAEEAYCLGASSDGTTFTFHVVVSDKTDRGSVSGSIYYDLYFTPEFGAMAGNEQLIEVTHGTDGSVSAFWDIGGNDPTGLLFPQYLGDPTKDQMSVQWSGDELQVSFPLSYFGTPADGDQVDGILLDINHCTGTTGCTIVTADLVPDSGSATVTFNGDGSLQSLRVPSLLDGLRGREGFGPSGPGTEHVELYVDGSYVGSVGVDSSSGSDAWSLDASLVAGAPTVSAEWYDAVGALLAETSMQLTVTPVQCTGACGGVGEIAPVLTLDTTDLGIHANNQDVTVTVSGRATDDNGDLRNVTLLWRDPLGLWHDEGEVILTALPDGMNWTFSHDLTFPEGSLVGDYVLTVMAVDEAGQTVSGDLTLRLVQEFLFEYTSGGYWDFGTFTVGEKDHASLNGFRVNNTQPQPITLWFSMDDFTHTEASSVVKVGGNAHLVLTHADGSTSEVPLDVNTPAEVATLAPEEEVVVTMVLEKITGPLKAGSYTSTFGLYT